MSDDLIEGAGGSWEVVIGLEVHAQVVSASKLFSGAATAFGAEPNSQVSLVDAAFPGMLPVINRVCVEQAVRTGLGLNARINKRSIFDRKNYFYPDLPAGYQISQYKNPIVGEGVVVLDMEDGSRREIGIERLHLEQDAGKSIHDRHPSQTYVDLNRAGVALMEIVSKPDMRSAAEAGAYLRKLRAILRYLGTCDGNMEEGSMRADVNVSVRRPGEPLGTRTETKNVNSIRFVQAAIQYEAWRQVELIESGGEVVQETRLFDPDSGRTREMRSKEEAHDYRYFPDPDLLPLVLEDELIDRLRAELPELPDRKKARFVSKYHMSPEQAAVLVAEREIADGFEEKLREYLEHKLGPADALRAVRAIHDPSVTFEMMPFGIQVESSAKSMMTFVTGEVFSYSNQTGQRVEKILEKVDLVGLQGLIDDGTVSSRMKKEVFLEMASSGMSADEIVTLKGLKQISDAGEIEALVERIVAENPDKAGEVRAGKDKLLGWFVGQVMKASGGKANPKLVNQALRTRLMDG